ncbi:hypothetical protein M427DRAFT_464021 [Gonapodya prolifera JEL478]|uniref:Calponin-homology (CH) domain-containing protein n=1 Tax=Gonapodya prolifera (strain JEL478) TaxID=1344416 RepID=A0A139A1R7_GONPJ|nr:hypothetical protein M427DRAFT_464021 [Gonapodya prolifera JEL478]|eukprot:KXS10691.1 hypothetical protein M427DRAFT_464021 [Gonapodya prolifera JEL478]
MPVCRDFNIRDITSNNPMESSSTTLHPSSQNDPHLKRLKTALVTWINEIMRAEAEEIRDPVEDLADGSILRAFMGKLTGVPMEDSGIVGLSLVARQSKVSSALTHARTHFGVAGVWTPEGIVSKDHVSVLSFLVELVRAVKAPVELPSNVSIALIKREDLGNGDFRNRTVIQKLTGNEKPPPAVGEFLVSTRDAFDELLLDGAQGKAAKITELMIRFVNTQYEQTGMIVEGLHEFSDGVRDAVRLLCSWGVLQEPHRHWLFNVIIPYFQRFIIFLLGHVCGFFVPLSHFHARPATRQEKLENVAAAIAIMRDWNAETARLQPSEIVAGEEVAILRCLYAISTLARKNKK